MLLQQTIFLRGDFLLSFESATAVHCGQYLKLLNLMVHHLKFSLQLCDLVLGLDEILAVHVPITSNSFVLAVLKLSA